MFLNARYHRVIVAENLTAKWMCGIDHIFDIAATTRCFVIKVCVTFSDDGFPDQKLCRIGMGNTVCGSFILRTPTCGNRSTITVLQNSTDILSDLISGNNAICLNVIEIVFIILGHRLPHTQMHTRFNTIANIT